MTTVILNSGSVRTGRVWVYEIQDNLVRLLIGCLEVFEMILEGTWAQK